jgi:hypothetical protein
MVGIFFAGWKPSGMACPMRAGGAYLAIFGTDSSAVALERIPFKVSAAPRFDEDGIFGNIFPASATFGRPKLIPACKWGEAFNGRC